MTTNKSVFLKQLDRELLIQAYCCCLVAKLCPILCDPKDCSPPGSFVNGVSQTRILEWVSISFARGSIRGISAKTLYYKNCLL